MKYLNVLSLSIGLGLFGGSAVQADEVLSQTGDTLQAPHLERAPACWSVA